MNNAFTGTIPAGISALTKLDALYALAPMPRRRRSTYVPLAVAVEQFTRWEPLQRQRAVGDLHTDLAQVPVPPDPPSSGRTVDLPSFRHRPLAAPPLRASPPLLPIRLGSNLRFPGQS